MRALLGCLLVLGLAVSPAIAGTSGSEAAATAASSTSSSTTSGNSSGTGQPAATSAPAANTAAKPAVAGMESELGELRDAMDSQAKQIQEQNDQLKAQQQKVQALEEKLKAANSSREALTASPATSPAELSPTVALASAAPSTSIPASSPAAAAAAPQEGAIPDSPLQFHLGSAYITPLGFMDFTGVGRTTNAGNGIGSNFGSIPYPFTSAAGAINLSDHATEARFSMQNSRIGLRVDALVKGAHVIGYLEADFLGNNAGSVAVTSNSNTLRSRLYWVDISKGKWEWLAGQSWSLITPGRTGISPLPGNVFFSNDIDVNYQLGLVWGRIPEFRFVYHPSSKMALAVALDQNEQYDGGSGGGASISLPAAGPGVAGGVAGLAGTQLNNASTTVNAPQVFPDLIVKAAFDPSPKAHFEIGGVERQFRVVVNSIASPATTTSLTTPVVNKTATGGGAFVNLNFQLFKGLRVVSNNYWSDGGGRYIFGLAPDVIVAPDGSLTDIQASSTLDGLEYTHGNSLIYSYYSAVYIDRNITTFNGSQYGYGVDATGAAGNYGSAIAQNRAIQEATIGINQTLWRDPKYGAFNFMAQYSYQQRDPWSTAVGQPKHTTMSIAFINLRYTLPGAAPAASALK